MRRIRKVFGGIRGIIALVVLLAGAAVAGIWPVLAAGTPIQIWFVPLTHNIKPGGHGLEYAQHDFPVLIQPNAPWQTAASHISVLDFQHNVVESYPDIPGLVSFLHSRPWKVAIGFSVMFDGGKCPKRLEGISQDADVNREAVRVARKWKQVGGTLDYIVLDSPFWFGHFEDKQCQWPTAEVARRAATTLRGILENFPNAKIVDAEGPGWVPDEQWLPEMAAFMAAVRTDLGHPIDAVSLDLHWADLRPGNTWQATARRSAAYFHRLGVATGLIINAPGGPGVTDQAWMEMNRQHLREAAQARLGLDFISINQWQNHVRLNLPENDPNAYTSLINDAYRDFGGAR